MQKLCPKRFIVKPNETAYFERLTNSTYKAVHGQQTAKYVQQNLFYVKRMKPKGKNLRVSEFYGLKISFV